MKKEFKKLTKKEYEKVSGGFNVIDNTQIPEILELTKRFWACMKGRDVMMCGTCEYYKKLLAPIQDENDPKSPWEGYCTYKKQDAKRLRKNEKTPKRF